MGKMLDNLALVTPPLSIFGKYTSDTSVTLVVKEKILSWSGSDYGIKDMDGHIVAKCRGKAWTLRGRRVITDPEGNPIYYLREKIVAWNRQFIAESESGQEVFHLTHKRFSLKAIEAITLSDPSNPSSPGSSTSQSLHLCVRGGFWGMSADVTLGEKGTEGIVGQIVRNPWTAKDIWTNKQTYHVKVAPGVDMALVAGIAICFDETMNDKSRFTIMFSIFTFVMTIVGWVTGRSLASYVSSPFRH